MTQALLVYITVSNRKEARRIVQILVEEKLAACVSIVPSISSTYWWKGKIESGSELLLVAKTITSRYKRLEKRVKSIHSYDVPEIVAIPIVKGNPDYLKWVKDSVR